MLKSFRSKVSLVEVLSKYGRSAVTEQVTEQVAEQVTEQVTELVEVLSKCGY